MFGNPKQIFKVLRAAGVKVNFQDDDGKKIDGNLVIKNDDKQEAHKFSAIEKMVNGDE